MENSKLVQLVKTFSKNELNEFGKFISSPFFNESPKLLLLYDLLHENYPSFPAETFNKQKIFERLYPEDKKYDDKKMRSRFNLMYRLGEEFLLQIEMKKNSMVSGRMVLEQLTSRRLGKHFDKKFSELNELVQRSEIVNERYFHDRNLQVRSKRNFYEFTKPVGKREEYYNDFSEETELFVRYSVLKLIKHYVIMKCDRGYLKYDFDYSFLEKLLEYIEEKKYTEFPIFEIFRNLLLLEENPLDENLFKKTKLMFYENIPRIEKDDAILIITEMYSLATRHFYGGNNSFVKVPFEIVSQMIKYEIYPLENGYMAERQYLDTVYTAFTARENVWAENFINNFRMKLNPEVRNNAFNYSISLLEMMRENYHKALVGFAKVRVDDFYYHMRIKYNRLRIFFEIEEFESIFTEIDAFKHYLSVNKSIPEDARVRALKFLSFYNRLIKATVNNDYREIELLRNELQSTDMELKRTLELIIGKILKQKT